MVKGLTFEMCQKGHMTPEVHDEFVQAIKDLESLHVSAITGDCAPPSPLCFPSQLCLLGRMHALQHKSVRCGERLTRGSYMSDACSLSRYRSLLL